jgi:hypothetical protein
MKAFYEVLKLKCQKKYISIEEGFFKDKKLRILFWGLIIGMIAISMYILNYLTPYIADDYHYLSRKDIITNEPLGNFGDYLKSIYNIYFNWGGRIIGGIYTYLLTFIPKSIVNILNTITYIIVVTLIYLNCKGSKKNMLSMFIGIHLLIWICVPDYGQVMFWICGVSNYLYSTLPILGMILIFKNYGLNISKKTYSTSMKLTGKKSCFSLIKQYGILILTFILGILSGCSSENASAGMLVVMTLYLIFYRVNHIRIKGYLIVGYIGSLIGYGILIGAPGNYVRSESEVVHLSLLFKLGMITYFAIAFMAVIFILYFIIAKITLSSPNIDRKKVILESFIFVAGAFSSAFCMVAAPTSPERTWFIVVIYALIAIGIFYSILDLSQDVGTDKGVNILLLRRITVGVILIVGIYCSVMWADTAIVSWEIKSQTQARNTYILSEVEKGNKDIVVPIITHKYPFISNHDALYGLSDIQEDPNYWINRSLAEYYGVHSITGY